MLQKVIQGMLSLHLAMKKEVSDSDFWEPLLEILAGSMEQKLQEDASYRKKQPLIDLRPTSNLLSMLASKKECVNPEVITKLYSLVTKGLNKAASEDD